MTAVEISIRIPDTVEEFLAACGDGDGWVLVLFGERSARKLLRTKTERYEIAAVPIRWEGGAPRGLGTFVGRAEYAATERVMVERESEIRGPIGECGCFCDGPIWLLPKDSLIISIRLTINP